jgi:hypothetical protein
MRVIRWDIRQDWSLDECDKALAETLEMIQQQPNTVFVVLNPIRMPRWPKVILAHLLKNDYVGTRVAGIYAVVEINPSTWLLEYGLFRLSAGTQYRLARSLERAYEMISERLVSEHAGLITNQSAPSMSSQLKTTTRGGGL